MEILFLLLISVLGLLLPVPIDNPDYKKERWYEKY